MRIVSYFTTRLMTDLPCQPSAIQSSDHVSHRIFRGPGTQNPGLCKTVWEFRNPTLPFSDTHLGTMRRWAKWIYLHEVSFPPHIWGWSSIPTVETGAVCRFALSEPVPHASDRPSTRRVSQDDIAMTSALRSIDRGCYFRKAWFCSENLHFFEN